MEKLSGQWNLWFLLLSSCIEGQSISLVEERKEEYFLFKKTAVSPADVNGDSNIPPSLGRLSSMSPMSQESTTTKGRTKYPPPPRAAEYELIFQDRRINDMECLLGIGDKITGRSRPTQTHGGMNACKELPLRTFELPSPCRFRSGGLPGFQKCFFSQERTRLFIQGEWRSSVCVIKKLLPTKLIGVIDWFGSIQRAILSQTKPMSIWFDLG